MVSICVVYQPQQKGAPARYHCCSACSMCWQDIASLRPQLPIHSCFCLQKQGCSMTIPDELSHSACKQCRPVPCHHVPDAGKRPGRYIAARCMTIDNMSHCSLAASTSSPLKTGDDWREEQRDKRCIGIKRHLGSIPSRRQASTDRGLVGSRLVALGSAGKLKTQSDKDLQTLLLAAPGIS